MSSDNEWRLLQEEIEIRKDWMTVFNEAIESGQLSTNESEDNFAGNYMYMCSDKKSGKPYFKHKVTRQYLDLYRRKQCK